MPPAMLSLIHESTPCRRGGIWKTQGKMMAAASTGSLLLPLLATAIAGLALFYFYYILWLRPQAIRDKLGRQGIKGPPPSLIHGNVLEMRRILQEEKNKQKKGSMSITSSYAQALFPYFVQWRNKYGPIFLYSTGSIQTLLVTHPGLVREISLYKSLDIGKPSYLQKERGALLGKGILTSNGALWAHQRRVIAPEFFMEKIKVMIELIVESSKSLLKSWENIIDNGGGSGEILVDDYLRNFSADVISKACFGSSFAEGKEIFSRLRQLQKAMAKSGLMIGIPGLRYLPTKNNRDIWRLNREIRILILNVVKKRKQSESVSSSMDLLQSVIEGANMKDDALIDAETFIVDNCKNIYFAGHETTAVSATWCLMLLAAHPEWQDRVRHEILEICQGQYPNFDMLRRLKMLTMVIQETLRLYPPATLLARGTLDDVKLGDIHIPKGITIAVPTSLLHHDPEFWGSDAGEFKPDRFSNGLAGACRFPHAYIPFSTGIRTCAGQNLAMTELKIVLSLIVSKFTFSLSSRYCHSPAFRLTIEPEFGVPLVVKSL